MSDSIENRKGPQWWRIALNDILPPHAANSVFDTFAAFLSDTLTRQCVALSRQSRSLFLTTAEGMAPAAPSTRSRRPLSRIASAVPLLGYLRPHLSRPMTCARIFQ